MDLHQLLNSLSKEEKLQLSTMLSSEFNQNINLVELKKSSYEEQGIICPHCKSSDIYGHGDYKGRKRYQCKSCKKTFNDFTGTVISGIKKVDKFQEYLQLVPESISIRKASKKLGISINTIFIWRHKILSCLNSINGQSLTGIVECDDKQVEFSEKGKRNLKRTPYKRPSDRKKKRGVSNDKVSVMVATDRKGGKVMHVAKMGRVDTESIEKTIGNLINKENILCSDSHPSIIKWAKEKELEHHTFVASKQHIKNKCYHVQHVNSMDNLYERWVKRFYGVATKYLDQYLNWFIFLEKTKKSDNPVTELTKKIVTEIFALKSYRSIENRYVKLMNPQYS